MMKKSVAWALCLVGLLLGGVSCNEADADKKNEMPAVPVEKVVETKEDVPEENAAANTLLLPRNNKTTPEGWCDDLNAALTAARNQNKSVLVLFTGSDWCGWCKKLKKETLNGTDFQKFADANLVLVYLDMPQDGLTEKQLQKNESLMKRLCGEGSGFPTTVILDYGGKKRGAFSGFREEDEYIQSIQALLPGK